jgi:fructose-1,6-bisphosphatase/inositol monophosphatase family enzyme
LPVLDPDKVSELIVDCAQQFILPRYQRLADHEVSSKTSPRDLVTQADIESEAFLERYLPDLMAGSLVVGEEGVSRGDHALEMLHQMERPVWVVDPVDGTYNFVHGKPEFGVMVTCVIGGEVAYAWIYDPLKEVMHVAEKGSGAYANTQKLRVSDRVTPDKMRGHINTKFFPEELRPAIEEKMEIFADYKSLGSAAHEYTRLARGESDVLLYSRLKPWDHLPGSLIVTEAGGYIAKWDRAPYTPRDDYAGLIVTNSPDSWDAVYDVVLGGFDLKAYL